jgi:hypothetical protein
VVGTARTLNYIRLLFASKSCWDCAFDYVVGDAEVVANVEGVRVFAENDAAIFEEGSFGYDNVFDGEVRNGCGGFEVAVDAEAKLAGVVFEAGVRAGQELELHHVGVEVFCCGDVSEGDGDAVV